MNATNELYECNYPVLNIELNIFFNIYSIYVIYEVISLNDLFRILII